MGDSIVQKMYWIRPIHLNRALNTLPPDDWEFNLCYQAVPMTYYYFLNRRKHDYTRTCG